MQMMQKHILCSIFDHYSLYAARVTRGKSVVLHWISGRGHLQSCDKNGGHIVWSVIAKKPCYTQTSWLCLI